MLATSLARMQQHVLDDGIGALAVLDHFPEIVLQEAGQFIDFLADIVGKGGRLERIVQFIGQFRRKRREIIDEIERVLDLVGDAGGELTEGGEFLGLHQAVLRGAQFVQRGRQLPGACLYLIEQPYILDRDHRLVGEGLEQLDVFFGKSAGLLARHADYPDRRSVAHQRREQHAAIAAQSREIAHASFGFGIDHLRGLALADQPERRKVGEPHWERSSQGFVRCRPGRGESRQVNKVLDEAKDRGREAADQPVGAGRNGLEHRLHVRGRTGDDLQDVGRRGLTLQCLPRLVEQAYILDCNHRLVGKGLEQGNLLIAVGARIGPAHRDRPDWLSLTQHRHSHLAARPQGFDHLPRQRRHRLIGFDVGDKVRPARPDSASRRRVVSGGPGKHLLHLVETRLAQPVSGDQLDNAVVVAIHAPHAAPAQPHRAFDDHVEYRLHVGRRTGDDLEDVGRGRLPVEGLFGLVEQPRILDGDDGLIGKALLKRKLFGREGKQPVTVDNQRTDRGTFASQWGAAHRARAGGTCEGQAGPVRHRRIDAVEVGNVDLLVPRDDLARQVLPADRDAGQRNGRADMLGTGTETVGLTPLAVLGELDRGAGGAEQPPAGLGDLLQRPRRVGRSAGDRAQDFGAGGLPILHGAQLGPQPGILLPEIGRHVRGKRGHSFKSIRTGPGGTAPNQQEPASQGSILRARR